MKQVATLAGGCFWCLEAVFNEVKGVQQVVSGYTGGETESPDYDDVCSGYTGHAEAIQVYFDSDVISYREILEIFFSVHDPTTLNRQGADAGTQYRSAVFYHDETQKDVAESLIKEIDGSGSWGSPVVTEVRPFTVFYTAEKYHQNYYETNPNKTYCAVIITPKLAKFRKKWADHLK